MTSVAAHLPGLRAVTRPFELPDDLLDARAPRGFAWLHDGHGFVTSGTAAIVEADSADEILGTLEVDDPLGWPGTGPIAVGALGFDVSSPGRLVIPTTVIGRTADGDGWITHVGDAAARLHVPGESRRRPCHVSATPRTDREEWRGWVEEVLRLIHRGQLEKVVLAREVLVSSDEPFSPTTLLRRLRTQQPGCFVHYADGLIGASPELLVGRVGTVVESRPMAGTARVGTDALGALQDSPKDSLEHRLVVENVASTLASVCESLHVDEVPLTFAFASVGHLTTPMRGILSEPARSALALARRLHPTPAVAGSPVEEALRAIARLEPRGRGRYSGPVGWVDSRGDGEWALALRGAQLDRTQAVLHAGAGIVTGSDPDSEWAETEAKLEPMLTALGVTTRPDPGLR